MPKGQTPRQNSSAKLLKLEEQLEKATTPTTLQKVKTLLKAYTVGIGDPKEESAAVKKLRRKIAVRQNSMVKNANKIPVRQKP